MAAGEGDAVAFNATGYGGGAGVGLARGGGGGQETTAGVLVGLILGLCGLACQDVDVARRLHAQGLGGLHIGGCGCEVLARFEVDIATALNGAACGLGVAVVQVVVGIPSDVVLLTRIDCGKGEVITRAQAGGAAACVADLACDDIEVSACAGD